MNINHYDLDSTVIKNREEKEIVDGNYQNDFFNFFGFFTRKNKSIKPRESILK